VDYFVDHPQTFRSAYSMIVVYQQLNSLEKEVEIKTGGNLLI